jgi:hypothetical protein
LFVSLVFFILVLVMGRSSNILKNDILLKVVYGDYKGTLKILANICNVVGTCKSTHCPTKGHVVLSGKSDNDKKVGLCKILLWPAH